jgi:hypothetical protein
MYFIHKWRAVIKYLFKWRAVIHLYIKLISGLLFPYVFI